MANFTRRIEWLQKQINEQRNWIAECEASGSYDGERGDEIKTADADALAAWELQLFALLPAEERSERLVVEVDRNRNTATISVVDESGNGIVLMRSSLGGCAFLSSEEQERRIRLIERLRLADNEGGA
jgi:hypothetical protein